jgi:hypothetical protein
VQNHPGVAVRTLGIAEKNDVKGVIMTIGRRLAAVATAIGERGANDVVGVMISLVIGTKTGTGNEGESETNEMDAIVTKTATRTIEIEENAGANAKRIRMP